MTLADEVRTEFARIRRRFEGCEIASIRMSQVEKIESYVSDLEARIAAQPPEPEAFEIDTTNAPVDAHFQLRRLKRMAAEDEAFAMGMK